jgi:hydroxymethylpyrimidine/phosphomethylpyrimidine kinase
MLHELLPDPPIPVALCLGGVDPSGGAGLLRDVITLASQGVFPMAVPLAETIQNGLGCYAIEAPAANPLLSLEALRPHLTGIWGVKVGLSALDAESWVATCDLLRDLAPPVRIWDPIFAPSLGVSHHDAPRLRRMAQAILLGGGWVVCPNLPEACILAGMPVGESPKATPFKLAEPLLDLGAQAVWLKGGHGEGDQVEDFWVTASGPLSLGVHSRLPGERRGTGCTLASSWLGYRIQGLDEVASAQAAAQWLRGHWHGALAPGGVGRPSFAPRNA